jgi:hypothetical protein
LVESGSVREENSFWDTSVESEKPKKINLISKDMHA